MGDVGGRIARIDAFCRSSCAVEISTRYEGGGVERQGGAWGVESWIKCTRRAGCCEDKILLVVMTVYGRIPKYVYEHTTSFFILMLILDL